MNTPYDEEGRTERIMDILVAVVGLVPKIILLLWILLAGGVPLMLQGTAADDTAATKTEPVAQATVEVALVAPTDVPATPTVPMLELVPAVQPPAIEDAGVLAPGDFTISPAALGLAWAAQQVGGAAVDPSNRQPGLPPHLLIDFNDNGSGATGDLIELDRPQIRIMPVAAYLQMLEAAGTPDAAAAFDRLKVLLDEQPTGDTADIPIPPVLGEVSQDPVARVDYLGFTGGKGVGYVAHYATADGPITNEDGFDYVIQGLTDDAKHYVLVIWPLSASFLPESVADVSEDALSAIGADLPAYLAGVSTEAENAADSDFTPDLADLRNVLGTIAIGSGVAAKADDVALAQTPAPELAGTVWQWTAFEDTAGENNITVENPANYEIVFWGDGSYSLKADCNVGGGDYVVDGASLTINPGMSSMAFCGEDSLDNEFREKLFNTASYVFDDDGNLVLNQIADGGNMVFANGGSAELVETDEPAEQAEAVDDGLTSITLHWTGFTDADGNAVEVENPEDYTLVLNPDGTFNIKADCNVGSGTYVYNDDGTVTLALGPLTRALCPPESLDDEFLSALGAITSVAVDDNGNVVGTLDDGRTVTLANAGPVSTGGDMTAVEMAPTDPIIGRTWQWSRFDDTADVNNIAVPDPENYTLTLWPDGAFSIKADCNVGYGDYTLDGASLRLVVGPTTRALCGPDSLSDTYIERLSQTVTYVIDDNGQLFLNLFADAGNMVFDDSGPAELGETAEATDQPDAADDGLTGLSFNWPGFTGADGSTVTTDNPEDYSLVLLPDGRFSIKADCNVGTGTFTYAEDGAITFDLGPLTRALCPPDSLSDRFLEFVQGIRSAIANPDGTVTATTEDGSESNLLAGGPVEIPVVTLPAVEGTGQPAPGGELFDTVWNWTSLEDPDGATILTVDDPTSYQVLFGTDARYLIRADCNTGSGDYSGRGDETINALTINPGITTLAACGPDSLDAQFTTNLFATESYTFDEDGNLRLALADGNTMVFGNGGQATELPAAQEPQIQPPAPTSALANTTWQWVNFRDAKQDYSVSGAYTVQFLPDGTVAVVADCNNGSGSYSVADSSLTISILITTAAACPQGSLGDVFIEYLNQAAIYTIDGTTMRIDLFADGGTMTFTQVP